MEKKNKIVLLFLLFLIVATSCKNDNDAQEITNNPETINTTFILFKEEKNIDLQSADGMSVGSLYIKKEEQEEIELIAKDVLDSAVYDNDTEEVLYLDDELNLYSFKSSDEKSTFIAKDVNTMYFTNIEDKKIVYITEDDSIHVYSDTETEKIGSNVNQFAVIGDDVYYNTQDNNLIIYNIATREEKRMANNVSDFRLLDDPNKIIYLSDDYLLHYLDNLEGDSIRISSDPVSLEEVVKVDEKVYYLEYQDGANELYLEDLSENNRPELITDDVSEFKVHGNDIYYLTSDSILYKLEDKDKSKRIAIDIMEFDIASDQLVFLDDDQTLHTWDPESDEIKKIGHDVASYEMFTNGELYYLTNENELFKENTKLANDVDYFSAFYDTLAYANEQSLYLIKDKEENLILEDSLDNYSVIYYQNYPVFENRLTLRDISGFWKFLDDERNEHYIEIKSNGTMTTYDIDYEEEFYLEVLYSGFNTLELMEEEYGEYISFHSDDGVLTMQVDEEDFYPLENSSRKEFGNYVENYEEEKEKKEKQEEKEKKEEEQKQEEQEKQEQKAQELEEAEYVVESFVTNLAEAINYGEFYTISQYINPASSFYDEQSEFVWDLYESGISEELYDYDIIESKMNEDQSISVKSREVFNVYNYDTGEDKRSTYQASYSLKKVDGEYLIDNLVVD